LRLKNRQPPSPYFKELKNDGKIIIGFRSDIFVVPNLQLINNGTVIPNENSKKRSLAITTNSNKQTLPAFQVEVHAGVDSNPEDLQFTWNVTKETKDELHVQLYFENPLLVSVNSDKDNITVTFNDPGLFTGMNGLLMSEQD